MDSSNPLHLLIPSPNPNNHHPPPPHHLTKTSSLPNPSTAAAIIRFPIAAPRHSPRRAMENFTALAMAFATSDPARPLTAARKALIEKRLRDFFPNFRTPNHPTYAAMIHRAIVELKEPEGSTEESISEFIRKQYDDLPWAHFTLLKHHLQKLCERGEIAVTSEKCYLLNDGITNLNSGPYSSPKRELIQRMQKRRRKKLRGRARRRRKVQIKEQNQPAEEQMEGQGQVQEQCDLVIEEQNSTEEPHGDLIEELNVLWAQEQEQQSVLIEEQNQLEGQVMDSEHLEQNQPEFPSPERSPGFNLVKVTELSGLQEQQLPEGSPLFCCQQKNPKLQLETMTTSIGLPMSVKQLQVEQQHEHPYPVEPSDPQLVEQEKQPEFSNSGRPLELCAQQKAFKSLPMTSTTSLALPNNSEPPEQCKLDFPNSGRNLKVEMTTKGEVDEFSHTLQQILEEQRQLRRQSQRKSEHKQPTMEAMRQLNLLKHRQELQQHSQLSGLEGPKVLKSVEKLPEMHQQQQGKNRGRKKQAKSRPEAIITQDVLMNSCRQLECPNTGRSQGPKLATVLPSSEEQQQQGKLHEGQREPISELETLTASLDLPESSKQQPDCSVPEKPMELVLVTMEQSYPEQQPDVPVLERPIELDLATMDQSSQTERMQRQLQRWAQMASASKPPTTSITELLPFEFQYQEPDLTNDESPPELKQTPVEESTQTTEQQAKLCGRRKQIKSQPKIITDSLNMLMAPQKLAREQPPELPSPERAQKMQRQQKQEKPQHRQLRPRPPKPEQATATIKGQHQHEEQQKKLPNMGTLQELKQKPVEESTRRGQKKLKLNGWQKLSEQKTRTDSLDSLLTLQWKPELQPVFPSPKRAKKQQDKQAQENPQYMKLRSWCPKSEAAAATTTAELVPVQDQHEEQQQLDCQDEGRPLERKSDMTSTVESSPSDHQNQHERQEPAPRGHGRPRKYLHNSQQQQEQTKDRGRGRYPKQPDDTTMENVFHSEKKLQEPKRRGWGRPRKLDKGK